MADIREAYLSQLATHAYRRVDGVVYQLEGMRVSNDQPIKVAREQVNRALNTVRYLEDPEMHPMTEDTQSLVDDIEHRLSLIQTQLANAAGVLDDIDYDDCSAHWSVFTDMMVSAWLERLPNETPENRAYIAGALEALQLIGLLGPIAPSTNSEVA